MVRRQKVAAILARRKTFQASRAAKLRSANTRTQCRRLALRQRSALPGYHLVNCNCMLQIARILVPVDFSERCLKMMPYVRLFAQKYQSELILLHVMNPVYTIPDTALSGPIALPLPERAFEHGAERLDGFAVTELQGLPVRRLLYEGDPETQIAETARTEDVQLLMMPTRGHGAFRTFLLGSITSKVLHDVALPILTGVHASEHSVSSISTIVQAGDSGDQTEDVLAWADGLAVDFQAKLVQAQPGLDPEAVCALAESSGANLLVMARGLRTGAYAIIRQSPCPVLSI